MTQAAERVVVAALVGLAVVMRLVCLGYLTSDLVVFGDWYDQLWAHGGIAGLREPIGNYNAPLLYLLVVAGFLPGATLLKIKLLWVAFDAAAIFFVYRLVALGHPGRRTSLVAALVVAFLPTVVVNAAMYGQCDSVWVSFALAGLYLLLRGRQWSAVCCCAGACAVKPQGVFILPVLLLLLLAGRVRWRTLLALPLVYLALDLPAIMLGRDAGDLLTIYARQVGEPSLVRGAPSVFRFVPVTAGVGMLRQLGYLFAAAVVLGVCYALVATRTRLDATRIVTAAAFFAIAVPFLLPSMHERYFYLADILTIVLAFYRPRLWYVPVLVQVASALSYLPFLFGGAPHGAFVDPRILSTCMLVALLATGHAVVRDIIRARAAALPDASSDLMPSQDHDRAVRAAGAFSLVVATGAIVVAGLESPALAAQSEWRCCHLCERLWFNGHTTKGVCPGNGGAGHHSDGSGNYQLRQV